MDIDSAELWYVDFFIYLLNKNLRKRNFLESAPSFDGIINGAYPTLMPLIYTFWSLVTVSGFLSLDNVYIRDIGKILFLKPFLTRLNSQYYKLLRI